MNDLTTMDTEQVASGEDIEGIVLHLIRLLGDRRLTLSVAESCSGGLLAKLLTDVAGSSSYFLAGVVAYSNAAKSAFLGVSPALIERKGAVSAEVAAAMAEGVLRRSGSDIALSVTGIAGPDGGTTEKPVGTVYLGLADSHGCNTMLLGLSGSRDQIRSASARNALDWATRHISSTAPATSKGHI